MKDKTIVAWANKILRALPDQWQQRLRIPQYKATEALDEVTKSFNMAEEHIRHMETQTRGELKELLDKSQAQAMEVAQNKIDDLKQGVSSILKFVYLNEDGIPTMKDPHELTLPERDEFCDALQDMAKET